MAKPSNQWLSVRSPTSWRAGPLRTSVPLSHAGIEPETSSSSSVTSRSWLSNPCRWVASRTRIGPEHTVHLGPLQAPRLTPTSYIVLGLLERLGPSTPYELKRAHAQGMGNFWTVQHAQFYSEPERLAEAGLLSEEREEGGRRRRRYTKPDAGRRAPGGGGGEDGRRGRHYTITDAGRRALGEWLAEPTAELTVELRDPGLLKLH